VDRREGSRLGTIKRRGRAYPVVLSYGSLRLRPVLGSVARRPTLRESRRFARAPNNIWGSTGTEDTEDREPRELKQSSIFVSFVIFCLDCFSRFYSLLHRHRLLRASRGPRGEGG